MRTIRRRLLQVGCIVLALTMLGIYVVRSQQSRQRDQIAPSSKMRALAAVQAALEANFPPASNSAPVIESKAGWFIDLSPQQSAEITELMMSGSKSLTPVSAHDLSRMLPTIFPASGETKPLPATNQIRIPYSSKMMPGSKSFGLDLIHIDETINELALDPRLSNSVQTVVSSTNQPAPAQKR